MEFYIKAVGGVNRIRRGEACALWRFSGARCRSGAGGYRLPDPAGRAESADSTPDRNNAGTRSRVWPQGSVCRQPAWSICDVGRRTKRQPASRSGTTPTSERIRSAWPAGPHLPQCQRHHHRQRQPDTGLHLGKAADVVGLEAEALVDAAVDPLHRRTPPVAAPQRRAAPRRGGEDAPVVTVEIDAHDAAVLSGLHPARAVARVAARALEAEGRRRAAVLESAAEATVGLEALERHRPLLARLGADARDPAPLVMNHDIGAVGEQRPRDRSIRVIARILLLGLPHQPRVDQRADGPLVPQPRLLGGVVETAAGAEVPVSPISAYETDCGY